MTPRRVLQALLAASLVGCSGESTGPDETPYAKSIEISPSSVMLAALGATAQLVGTVMDQHGQPMAGSTVSWSSSAPGMAGVLSAGVVTAVSNGNATVTARSGGVSASVDVKVQQAPVSLQVSMTELDFSALADTIRVVAVVKDANGNPVADAQVTWRSSDASVATVDGTGLVTAVGQGTATLTATAGTASSSVSVTVDAERVVITTDVLPYARLDRDYTLALEANAERWVFAWSVASGRLPTGLELTDDGVSTGRPREPGTATFTLRALDRVKDRETTREFTLEVYCGSDLCASTAYNAWPTTSPMATTSTGPSRGFRPTAPSAWSQRGCARSRSRRSQRRRPPTGKPTRRSRRSCARWRWRPSASCTTGVSPTTG